jgi:hypothetical protein
MAAGAMRAIVSAVDRSRSRTYVYACHSQDTFFEKCVAAKDATDWLYENLRLEKRDEAVELLRHLEVRAGGDARARVCVCIG